MESVQNKMPNTFLWDLIPLLQIAMAASLFLVSKKKKMAVGKLPVFRMHLGFARTSGILSLYLDKAPMEDLNYDTVHG